MSDRITFGQSVGVKRVLSRVMDPKYNNGSGRGKSWQPHPIVPKFGIVIGKRTLVNGYYTWFEDEGSAFFPAEYVQAYLVAFDMRSKPALVLPEDVIEMDEVTS